MRRNKCVGHSAQAQMGAHTCTPSQCKSKPSLVISVSLGHWLSSIFIQMDIRSLIDLFYVHCNTLWVCQFAKLFQYLPIFPVFEMNVHDSCYIKIILDSFKTLSYTLYQPPCQVGKSGIIVSILQMKNLRLKEVVWFFQGHKASKAQLKLELRPSDSQPRAISSTPEPRDP